ncbi:MAG: ThuA domain-containing protein [Chitinophagaceae bacterium]
MPLTFYAQSKKPSQIPVLIIDGFSNHDWRQTTKMIKGILEESTLFKVDVSTIPSTPDSIQMGTWHPEFSHYPVIIQNTNNIQNTALKWPAEMEKQLENYVSSGGGLYVLHSANNAFPHWKEYDRIIGLGWRPKETGFAIEIDSAKNLIRIPPGEGKGTNHGPRTNARIHTLNTHPVNKGFPAEWITPSMEIYNYARGPAENLTILSYAFDTATRKNWPVEWVVRYGKGRVYASSMGHLWKDEIYPISYRCIGFQTIVIRATEWLATGKVTYAVPTNFPKGESMSVREENDVPRK